MVLFHPPGQSIEDQFPYDWVLGLHLISGPAPVHQSPPLITTQVDALQMVAQRVDIEECRVVKDDIHDHSYSIGVQSLDELLKLSGCTDNHLCSIGGMVIRCSGVAGLGSHEEGGHVAPVVDGVRIPGVVKPLLGLLPVGGLFIGEFLEWQKLDGIDAKLLQIGESSSVTLVEPLFTYTLPLSTEYRMSDQNLEMCFTNDEISLVTGLNEAVPFPVKVISIDVADRFLTITVPDCHIVAPGICKWLICVGCIGGSAVRPAQPVAVPGTRHIVGNREIPNACTAPIHRMDLWIFSVGCGIDQAFSRLCFRCIESECGSALTDVTTERKLQAGVVCKIGVIHRIRFQISLFNTTRTGLVCILAI